jgi:hypothetical protein
MADRQDTQFVAEPLCCHTSLQLQVFFDSRLAPDIAPWSSAFTRSAQLAATPPVSKLMRKGFHPFSPWQRAEFDALRAIWLDLIREMYSRPLLDTDTSFWACLRRAFPGGYRPPGSLGCTGGKAQAIHTCSFDDGSTTHAQTTVGDRGCDSEMQLETPKNAPPASGSKLQHGRRKAAPPDQQKQSSDNDSVVACPDDMVHIKASSQEVKRHAGAWVSEVRCSPLAVHMQRCQRRHEDIASWMLLHSSRCLLT